MWFSSELALRLRMKHPRLAKQRRYRRFRRNQSSLPVNGLVPRSSPRVLQHRPPGAHLRPCPSLSPRSPLVRPLRARPPPHPRNGPPVFPERRHVPLPPAQAPHHGPLRQNRRPIPARSLRAFRHHRGSPSSPFQPCPRPLLHQPHPPSRRPTSPRQRRHHRRVPYSVEP